MMVKILGLLLNISKQKFLVFISLFTVGAVTITLLLPVQLFPSIAKPIIEINTGWAGATAYEIESEIAEPIERAIKNLSGIGQITSNIAKDTVQVTVELKSKDNSTKQYIDLVNKLNQIPNFPESAMQPQAKYVDDPSSVLGWFFLKKMHGNDRDIRSYYTYAEKELLPRLEQIEGVDKATIYFEPPEEIVIRVDPYLMVQHGISLTDFSSVLSEAKNMSAGYVDVGERQFVVRYSGADTIEALKNTVLRFDELPIAVKDVAKISLERRDVVSFATFNSEDAILIRIEKAVSTNLLTVLGNMQEQMASLNNQELKAEQLELVQSYDPSVFIYRALSFLSSSLFLGFLVSSLVLYAFCRHYAITAISIVIIPISMLGAMLVLYVSGQTVNIISLAGLALSVGMLLDSAIAVVMSISHSDNGKVDTNTAIIEGVRKVTPALFCSTLTTIIVFIPVFFSNDIGSQLFKDLSITISASLIFSFFIAISIIPVFYRYFVKIKYHTTIRPPSQLVSWQKNGKFKTKLAVILLALPLLIMPFTIPKVDYLPYIKRDAVDVFVSIPPGKSRDKLKRSLADYFNKEISSETNKHFGIKNYYVLAFPGGSSIGIRLDDQDKVPEFMGYLKDDLFSAYKDANAIVFQGALLGQFGGGRSIDVNLTNKDLRSLNHDVSIVKKAIKEKLPDALIQVAPNLDIPDPLLNISPNVQVVRQNHMSIEQVGQWIQTIGNGWFLGEFFDGSQRHHVYVKSDNWSDINHLYSTPILTEKKDELSLSQLVDVNVTASYSNIRRVNGERAFTLSVIPPEKMSMSEATVLLRELELGLSAKLDPNSHILIAGNSSDFESLLNKLIIIGLVGLVALFIISFLTFGNMSRSVVLIMNLPLCYFGGVLGYQLLAQFVPQTFNIIVLFGFVILTGIVVNNIILLIDEVNHQRKAYSLESAIENAIKIRGPIVNISALTTVGGLLPMVLSPATGAELYQGLAAVVMGGMLISLLCTYLITPFLLRLQESMKNKASLNLKGASSNV